jgi:hypothetical protein
MSRAIASARQRRAGITQPEPPLPTPPQKQSAGESGGFTLPQVIAVIDKRLIKLEAFMKETQENPRERLVKFTDEDPTAGLDDETNDISSILEEFNGRFLLLAEEMGQLKDTLMKLQTYTMDVNKMLLDERVNVLSDLGNDTKTMYVMDDSSISGEVEKIEE